MKTFKNTSDNVFQDGDLIVKPGESFSTEDPGRILQMTDMYAWQFAESEGDNAPTVDEIKADPARHDVREVRAADHVQLDDEGKQADKIDNKK